MDNSVLIALLSLAGTMFGSWMGVRQANKLVNYRIDKLEEKVDAHNSLVERMALVEASTRSAHKRIDTLERREDKD